MLTPAFIDIAVQSWLPLLLLPVAAGLAWWGYRHTTPALDARQRLFFVVLRTLAFSLLLIVLASPVLNRVRNEPLRPQVAILVDTSASMSTIDSANRAARPGNRDDAAASASRAQYARGIVEGIQAALRQEDVAVSVIPFAMTLEPSVTASSWLSESRTAEGAGTDILGALEEVGDRFAGRNLQSIVLLTDGRSTHGGLDASELASLGCPIYVVGLGDSLPAADLAIDRCEYGPVAYVESQTILRVRIDNHGFRGQGTRLRLLRGQELLFEQHLLFDQESGRIEIEIPVDLKEPGSVRLSLVLDPLQGELTERNNSREIRIHVLKNKLRALMLDAQPDWDTAFLVRTLRDDPNVDLELVHHDARKRWIRADGSEFELPETAAAQLAYDLLVIGAPGTDQSLPFWEQLPRTIEAGRGLLVLPGRNSVFTTRLVFAALQDVLPVVRAQRRAPHFRSQAVRLTTHGRLHPATTALQALADPRRVLTALPPLLGMHAGLRSKPGALNLLVVEGQPQQPVLSVARYGNGRVAAIGGFPMWRWGFTPDTLQRQAIGDFVGHLVRWLVQPRDIKHVQLATGKPVYEGGERADLLAQVVDAQLQPLADAELRVEVRSLDAARNTQVSLLLEANGQHPGEYEGTLVGLGPGEYEATVVADRLGTVVGRDTTRFTVETWSIEFANTSQDVEFLRELAQRSGGRYTVAVDVARWVVDLPRAPRPVLLRSEIEIWNTRTLFFLFVLLLATEWFLRKRHGLL